MPQTVQVFGAQTATPNTSPVTGNPSVPVAVDNRGVVRVSVSAGGVNVPGQANNADNVAVTALLQNLPVIGYNYLFDGTAYDRQRLLSADGISQAAPLGAALIAAVGNWAINSVPAAAAVATITRAAVANQRHVCTSITAWCQDTLTGFVAPLQVVLRDGASGAGTILWSTKLGGVSGTGLVPDQVVISGLSIFGSVNTAMTLEFSAAPGVGNFETVAMTGYTTA